MKEALRMHHLSQHIRSVPDFPSKDVVFRDISPLLEMYFNETVEAMAEILEEEAIVIDAFAGVDARGFIFAAALAQYFGKNFKMIRKAGKIPPPFSEMAYDTEYSTAEMQVGHGKGRLIIVDDVLATGGTMTAAAELCVKAGYKVEGLVTLIDLPFIHNHSYQWNGLKVKSLISYNSPLA